MATRQVYATKDFKYGTRMMRAGDALEMTGPDQRLYRALGAISTVKPKREARDAGPGNQTETVPARTGGGTLSEAIASGAAKRTVRKAATRRKAAKKAK